MCRLRPLVAAIALFAGAASTQAQHGGAPVAPAEVAQFDFLVGQWDIEATPKVNGLVAMIHGTPHLLGSWKAWRAFDGFGVDDELRLVDGGGNPVALGRALRVFDPKAHRWSIESLDVYGARFSAATATWQGGEMHVSGSGTSVDGKAYLSRTRFCEITADRFTMRQDRSYDNGATWDEGAVTIRARRVAAKAQR
jgi:hypothetical protein